jgi:N-hydroxyarylamine O-acetyltransferase
MTGGVVIGHFRLDPYLDRIGIDAPVTPDLATLKLLHAAHAEVIPFEGLDPLLGRPVRLDLDALQAKLVDSRRGGYCYEQNLLFKAALEAIGFAVTPLGARVRWVYPPDSPLGPKEHAVLKVVLPEGAYLADVGFGACVMDAPLALSPEVEQPTAMGVYRLAERDGHYWLSAKQPGGWRTMYAFDLAPQLASDYELGNYYTSTSNRAPFTSMLIMEKVGRDRRVKLVNTRLLVEARDGEPAEQRALETPEALGEALDAQFNVAPPLPVEAIFAKVSGRPA